MTDNDALLEQCLKKFLLYDNIRPGHLQGFKEIIQGRDVILNYPLGDGKTRTSLSATIHNKNAEVLVIVPLRVLRIEWEKEILNLGGYPATDYNSFLTNEKPKYLIICPEKLLSSLTKYLKEKDDEKKYIWTHKFTSTYVIASKLHNL